jgi:hypothetical protein
VLSSRVLSVILTGERSLQFQLRRNNSFERDVQRGFLLR